MRRIKLNRLFGGGSVGSLTLLLLAILACPGFSGANAVNEYIGYPNEADAVTQSEERSVVAQAWVKSMVSIALGSQISLDTSKATNGFSSDTVALTVSTNGDRGFKVLANAVDGAELVSSSNNADKIPSLTEASTPNAFPTSGAWGYYADANAPTENSKYQPITTTPAVIKETSTSSTINNYKFSIGVKVSTTQPVGKYQNNIMVSVLANPVAVRNLAAISTMQEMTPEVCAETPSYVDINNYSWKTLVDNRVDNDGNKKSYKVAKLADGNCWMVENLAYSLGKEMTWNDTDLAPGVRKTLPVTTTSTGGLNPNNNYLDSRHPNDYWYYQWGAATAGSNTNATTNGAVAQDSICPRGWQLPLTSTAIIDGVNINTNTVSGSFKYLFDKHGLTTVDQIGQPPLSFVRAGGYSEYYLNGVGSNAMYWSRVAKSNTYAYYLTNSLSTTTAEVWYYGFSVRCVARRTDR